MKSRRAAAGGGGGSLQDAHSTPLVRLRDGLRWAVTLAVVAACVGACGRTSDQPLGAAAVRTHCGWDGGGACPSLGHGSPTGAHPSVIGEDTEVNLARDFTSDAVTTLAAGLLRGGLAGRAFPLQAFPSTGTLTLTVAGDVPVPFFIPPHRPGDLSALSLARQVVIPTPQGRYGTLWLLEAGVGGNTGPLDLGLRYRSGRTAIVPVTFGDWCNGGFPMADAPPEYVGISLSEVLTSAAALRSSAAGAGPPVRPARPEGAGGVREVYANCGLWAEAVPLPPSASPLQALVVPARSADVTGQAFIMAMTLEAGGTPPLGHTSSS